MDDDKIAKKDKFVFGIGILITVLVILISLFLFLGYINFEKPVKLGQKQLNSISGDIFKQLDLKIVIGK